MPHCLYHCNTEYKNGALITWPWELMRRKEILYGIWERCKTTPSANRRTYEVLSDGNFTLNTLVWLIFSGNFFFKLINIVFYRGQSTFNIVRWFILKFCIYYLKLSREATDEDSTSFERDRLAGLPLRDIFGICRSVWKCSVRVCTWSFYITLLWVDYNTSCFRFIVKFCNTSLCPLIRLYYSVAANIKYRM